LRLLPAIRYQPSAIFVTLSGAMRAAAILGLGSTPRDLKPFQIPQTEWSIGLPASRDGLDVILVFGGDGTVHRHLRALVSLQLPVLVVPAGSGNDFARALGLLRRGDSLAAWERFVAGRTPARAVDLGTITPIVSSDQPKPDPTYFCCAAGVGLDGEIARRADELPRWLRAHGGYALSLPGALLAFRPFNLKLTTADPATSEMAQPRPDQIVVAAVFANTPFYGGGMRVAPKAQLDDGRLDVCLIHDIPKLKLLSVFPTVYFGGHLGIREVDYFPVICARVETDRPLDVYADGERVCSTPVEIGVAHAVLKVIAP
jgi:diacylglycerol kinase (ATP)